MKNIYDIEQTNRINFRSSLEALARPGELQPVLPLFGSGLLAMASVLLYSEMSYFYEGPLDFGLIQVVCGASSAGREDADYLFYDSPNHADLSQAKTGTAECPELGATLLFSCSDAGGDTTKVKLFGPGIDGSKKINLPVRESFIKQLAEKNESFPMGIDLFLLGPKDTILGLPRTTSIKVIA